MQIIVSCLFISIALLAGCKQTQDEEREALFKPRFEQAMDDKDYCKAVEMANSRFNYTENPDRAVDRKKQYKRVQQWLKAGKEAEVECNKLKWVAIKQQYEKEIQVLQQQLSRLEQLQQRFTITWHQDDVHYNEKTGYKYTPLRINNQTSYRVTGFQLDYRSFNGEYGHKGFNYPDDLGVMGYDRASIPVFESGAESTFDLRVVDTPPTEVTNSIIALPLAGIRIIENGQTQRYTFDQIASIRKQITELQQHLQAKEPDFNATS